MECSTTANVAATGPAAKEEEAAPPSQCWKGKSRIRMATRKDRVGMKRVNELCLTENYELKFWETMATCKCSAVLEQGGQICGYAAVLPPNVAPPPSAVGSTERVATLASFALLPACRKQPQRFASQLLDVVARQCATSGFSAIQLQVRDTNSIARRLYEKHGYAYAKKLTAYYANGEDAHLMILTLPSPSCRRPQ